MRKKADKKSMRINKKEVKNLSPINTVETVITQEGLENLKKELKRLVEEDRPLAVERVKGARDMGSLDDNPEYDSAREQQVLIEGKIEEIKDIIQNARVVSETNEVKGVINVGSTVKVEINGGKEIFTIVGTLEADPASGKISHESPVGKALLGLKVGDKVKIKLPHGEFTYKILEVR